MRIENRSPFQRKGRSAYRVENKADETTVYIYDEISWYGVDAAVFVKDFNKIKSETINVRINSPGGSVFDGLTIFNAIEQHSSKTVVHVDGLAASIASVIAMAADEVVMAENAFLMIHPPWSFMGGSAEDFRKEAELLDKISGTIAKTYTDKSGKEEKDVLDMMEAETWMTAQEAYDEGFIDTISENSKEKASVTAFDLSIFAKVPDKLKNTNKTLTARDIENALKDVGCTQKQAKSIMSEGFRTDLRDVADAEIIPAEEEDLRGVTSLKQDIEIEEDLRGVTSPEQEEFVITDPVALLLARAERIAPSPHPTE